MGFFDLEQVHVQRVCVVEIEGRSFHHDVEEVLRARRHWNIYEGQKNNHLQLIEKEPHVCHWALNNFLDCERAHQNCL